MHIKLSQKRSELVFLSLILCAALFLFLYNLGNQYLWQDEAENALVSKTILTDGIPRGFDGKNFFSQEKEASYGKDYLWILDPWLPYYLLALFFKIFGITTFTVRLPFALFGVATILLTYYFARLITKDKRTAALAAVTLMLSVPFILLCRQSRYYSLVAFFSLLGLYGYLILLEKNKVGLVIFLLSGIVLFHCNHLFCAIFLITVFAHTLLCHRRQTIKVFFLSLIVVLLNLPWLLWVSKIKYTSMVRFSFLDKTFFWYLKEYLLEIHRYIFPFYLLLIPVGKSIFIWTKHKNVSIIFFKDVPLWRKLFLLILFILCTIVILSAVSPLPYFRYMTQLIPVFCIITAIILMTVIRNHFNKAVIIIALILVGAFYADYRYRQTYPDRAGIKYLGFYDYIYEITHDYNGPLEGIVKYLNKHGSKDDIVTVTYGDLPLKFYTRMKVVGGLTGEDLSMIKQADWVILRKYTIWDKDREVRKYLIQNLPPLESYEKIVIDYPDIPFENRESPGEHNFRTVADEDRVVIFRRIR